MSLQYYDFQLAASQSATQEISAQGRYIYYYSGTTPLISGGGAAGLAAAGNQAIKITSGGTGNSLLLLPGQSYRLPDSEKVPNSWKVTNLLGAEVITGRLLVGEGEFVDSNTNNIFKLDATFANNVTVNNTTANRVPVTLDTTQILNVAGNTVQYTNSFSNASILALTAQVIFSPAANVNGAYVEFIEVGLSNGIVLSDSQIINIIAKNSAPANQDDGDVVFTAVGPSSNGGTVGFVPVNITQSIRIKIPAGKGLYLNQTSCNGYSRKTVLYTLL